jgi:type II secretory ATPase GspE/PulE/Tfp pilus assembly ATPase PilB-like protein
MKLITEEAMVQALSHQLNFPLIHNLDQRHIDSEVLDMVPAELAEQHSVVPFNVQGKFLDVAMSDPTNLGIIDELRIRTRLNVRPYLAGPKAIERAIARHYGRGIATINFGTSPLDNDPNTAPPQGMRMLEAGSDNALRPAPPVTIQPAPASQSSAPSAAAARRAQQFDMNEDLRREQEQTREIQALQARVQHLEALVARDEDVLRKVLGLLIEKGLATREEILERIK